MKGASKKQAEKARKKGNSCIGLVTQSNSSAPEMGKWPSSDEILASPVAADPRAVVGLIQWKMHPFAVVSAAAENGVPGDLEKGIQSAKGIQRKYSYDHSQILHPPYLLWFLL